jgi:predicted dehydrogenase
MSERQGSVKEVLIVGAGGIANRHAGAIARIAGLRLAGVVDIVPERAQALAERSGAHAYRSLEEALASRPDYVTLCTPREYRLPAIAACAAAGVPVLMEKPPCHNLSTGRRIQELLQESGLLHAVGFMHRWHQALHVVLERLAGERLSTIQVSFQSPFATEPVYDTYPAPYLVERSGGLVGDQGIHYVDLCRYIARAEVKRMQVMGLNQVLPRSQHVTTCDVACWFLEMDNGVAVTHTHTWAGPGWACALELVTDRSQVRVDLFANRAAGSLAGQEFTYHGTVDEFELEHRGFLAAVEQQDQRLVRSPYADALESFRVQAELNRLLYGGTPELE